MTIIGGASFTRDSIQACKIRFCALRKSCLVARHSVLI
jgi:hypothetical protein